MKRKDIKSVMLRIHEHLENTNEDSLLIDLCDLLIHYTNNLKELIENERTNTKI